MLRKEITHYYPDLEEFETCHRFINNPYVQLPVCTLLH